MSHAAKLEGVIVEEMQRLIDEHPSVLQGRAIGNFGCIDTINPKGHLTQPLQVISQVEAHSSVSASISCSAVMPRLRPLSSFHLPSPSLTSLRFLSPLLRCRDSVHTAGSHDRA